jgi:Fic family protein
MGCESEAARSFCLRFLDESNAIENVHFAPKTLRKKLAAEEGHAGALAVALRLAEAREPVTTAVLCQWQAMITREQLPLGHWIEGHWIEDRAIGRFRWQTLRIGTQSTTEPEDIEARVLELLGRLDAELPALAARDAHPSDGLRLAAEAHHRYERIHPFVDGNGRSGRLLVLYVLRYLRISPVLFTANDRHHTYYPCFRTEQPELMVRYFEEHLHPDPWQAAVGAAHES